MEHLSDVGTRFAEVVGALDFRVEPCCRLYPLDFRAAFASSDFSLPSLPGPALRSACQASRLADWRLFRVPHNRFGQLRWDLDAGGTPILVQGC